jgi:hypothetical protein
VIRESIRNSLAMCPQFLRPCATAELGSAVSLAGESGNSCKVDVEKLHPDLIPKKHC